MIKLLNNETIDKIAAGEVVERPLSVVKELVENAIDAGSVSISVEIKNGGIDLIRVTDDGCGIPKAELRTAFLRHATSKIVSEDDLFYLSTLGFRGEALPSIASVSEVEIITKTKSELTAARLKICGGEETEFDEIGAPDGTTILVRNLFFNVPVRKKFLKSPQTEAGYVNDLVEKLALSNPHISFKLTINNNVKFITKGNGNLKEVIYKIYGRDTAQALIPISYETDGIEIAGYICKPEINNGSRDGENYYINNRYVKSQIINSAIEDGYREFMMQHRFPYCFINLYIDKSRIDVNVHPTKMDVRIDNSSELTDILSQNIKASLQNIELIPNISLTSDDKTFEKQKASEPFEISRKDKEAATEIALTVSQKSEVELPKEPLKTETVSPQSEASSDTNGKFFSIEYDEDDDKPIVFEDNKLLNKDISNAKEEVSPEEKNEQLFVKTNDDYSQLNFFEETLLKEDNIAKIKVLGQLFDTYWLIEFDSKLYILDQHAAHEKVKYEEFVAKYHSQTVCSQQLNPAFVISLSNSEMAIYREYIDYFKKFGFETEDFGSNEIYITAVPVDFYKSNIKDLFFEILNGLKTEKHINSSVKIEENIATMACKAAVKGNNSLSIQEVKQLLDDLLKLNNPYNCPHGRPTMISFTKYEIEKKFKRIV